VGTITVTAYNPSVDNGEGVATFFSLVKVRRPATVRGYRPAIIRIHL
jgi:hypothetical protein